jgi:hypothetical protein
VSWSREVAEEQRGMWLAKACDALMRASEQREAARRWRSGERDSSSDPVGDLCRQPWAASAGGQGSLEARESGALDEEIAREAKSRGTIRAYYAAARHAVALARVYRSEPGTTGRREREVVEQVRRYREAIGAARRALRGEGFTVRRPDGSDGGGPGLSKTSAEGTSAVPRSSSGARVAG